MICFFMIKWIWYEQWAPVTLSVVFISKDVQRMTLYITLSYTLFYIVLQMSACTLYVHELEIEYVHICCILDLYNVPELIFLHYCHMFHCLVSFNTKIAKTHHSPWTSVSHSLFSFPFFVYSEINVPSQTQSLYIASWFLNHVPVLGSDSGSSLLVRLFRSQPSSSGFEPPYHSQSTCTRCVKM